ncbi:thioredoxin-like protein [Polyporus arcularius HHB13444]|uniref:thioredoxin-dependent peroxiredoxin n=2 Tax=Polyporaceae TaxID=5317 RepID=A0A5C3PD02_9APHY|nr:thioredoxin-like protein [Polyporus brumalis]TFK87111.1 thioredoxin-like protein [Polyporus arcularius HHB13444]
MVATVQKPAPAFKGTAVVDGLFQDISLSDYLGQWVVLFFYPLDFTFVCPTEILAFNDALPQFKAINTALIAASTDSHFSHLAWATQPRKQGGLGPDLKLPLLADKTMQISRDYGVLIEDEGVALRGLFIIDPKGILRQITINDLPVGRSVEETLRLVKAFQFTDEHGEVCPANWTEGSKTMKADPKGALEYFSSVDANGANGNVSKKRARVD